MVMSLWLIDVLSSLYEVTKILISISIAVSLFSGFFYYMNCSFNEEKTANLIKPIYKISAISFFILLFIHILTPSPKTAYLIFSVNVIQNVSANEKVSSLAEKSILILEQKMDEFLK